METVDMEEPVVFGSVESQSDFAIEKPDSQLFRVNGFWYVDGLPEDRHYSVPGMDEIQSRESLSLLKNVVPDLEFLKDLLHEKPPFSAKIRNGKVTSIEPLVIDTIQAETNQVRNLFSHNDISARFVRADRETRAAGDSHDSDNDTFIRLFKGEQEIHTTEFYSQTIVPYDKYHHIRSSPGVITAAELLHDISDEYIIQSKLASHSYARYLEVAISLDNTFNWAEIDFDMLNTYAVFDLKQNRALILRWRYINKYS